MSILKTIRQIAEELTRIREALERLSPATDPRRKSYPIGTTQQKAPK